MEHFEQDLQQCLQVLHSGRLILYWTDWGWCIGCDATQALAVTNLRNLLPAGATRQLPVLLSEERDVLQWVAAVDLSVFDFVTQQQEPMAIRFEYGLGFADNLPVQDGSVLIGLTRDVFCRHLVKRFRKPIVAFPYYLVAESNTTIVYTCKQHPQQDAGTKGLQVLEWNNGTPVIKNFE